CAEADKEFRYRHAPAFHLWPRQPMQSAKLRPVRSNLRGSRSCRPGGSHKDRWARRSLWRRTTRRRPTLSWPALRDGRDSRSWAGGQRQKSTQRREEKDRQRHLPEKKKTAVFALWNPSVRLTYE